MLKPVEKVVSFTGDSKPMDTRVNPFVRIVNGALDEDDSGEIVLNGRLDPNCLRFLKVDDYQRPGIERADIYDALHAGDIVPNIVLNVRGQKFKTVGDNIEITADPVYIVDGWQRVFNALRLLEKDPNLPIRLFATIYFAHDKTWERHKFTVLNLTSKRVSSSHHLRNLKDDSVALGTLFDLCTKTPSFPLYKRVAWAQNMTRGELVQAYLLVRAVARLHAHLGTIASAGSANKLTAAVDQLVAKTTRDVFKRNVVAFFDLIEECWGIRNIEYRSAAAQVKSGFILQLARMISAHTDFWDASGRTFFISADKRRKLKTFPVNDSYVRNLAGAGQGTGGQLLYDLMVKHMNSGKRTGHLRSRYSA